MRHGNKINHLGRTSSHRQALLSNMAVSLILSKKKRISTTLAKAKALRTFIEPLITRSKKDSTHSRRVVFGYLQDKEAVTELFREVASKIEQRPGGYTRIMKTGFRKGDNADMCLIELVDYNENLLSETKEKKTKTTRRSRGASKKTADDSAPIAIGTETPKEKKPAKKTAKSELTEIEGKAKEHQEPENKTDEKSEETAEGKSKE